MPPTPSLCLNVPKTGSSYAVRFFLAADCLELARRFGLRCLAVPGPATQLAVRGIKRYVHDFGSRNSRIIHHAGYSALPCHLRALPKVSALRPLKPWYRSYYVYNTRFESRPNLLSRAIGLLADGDARGLKPYAKAFLLRHRREFLERFAREREAGEALEHISLEFFFWFDRVVRTPLMMRNWLGLEMPASPVGFLTLRVITMLFDNPRRVLGMNAGDRLDYFESGRYRRDVRAEFILDFDRLTDQLAQVMTEELNYAPDIVAFLAERLPRRNVSAAEATARAGRELDKGDLFERLRVDDAIYEKYLLPLAGRGLS